MAAKLIYVRFDYNMSEAPLEATCFVARRRIKNEDGAVYCARGSRNDHLDRKLMSEEWDELSDALFEKLCIQNWKRVYRPENACDREGCEWRLMIALEDGTKYEFTGENAVPERWDDMVDVFKPYFIELEALPEPELAERKIDPVTGEPYPDVSENVWSRFDDDGYGIHDVVYAWEKKETD